jgi:hypothetical protein
MNPLDTIIALRQMGVTRATFHADGSIASVEFSPALEDASSDARQHDTPKASTAPPKRVATTGGLVPRAVDERD